MTVQDHHTRLEAIKILVPLYSQGDYMSSIRTFTTRAIPRIMEMAVRDVSIPVRVEAIKVLISLDASGFLSDEDEDKREGLGCLLFDRDIKVRKAISGLLKNWYDERVTDMKAQVAEERERQPGATTGAKGKAAAKEVVKRKAPAKRGRRDEDEEQDQEGDEDQANDSDEELSEEEPADISDLEDRFVELKVLASMILGFSTRLQRSTESQGSQGEITGTQTQQAQKAHDQQVLAALASVTTARDTHATVAAETFWNTDLEAIHDWSSMIEYLAIDHSTSRDEGKVWALEEEQETFFLDMLAVVVAKAVTGGKGKKVSRGGVLNHGADELIITWSNANRKRPRSKTRRPQPSCRKSWSILCPSSLPNTRVMVCGWSRCCVLRVISTFNRMPRLDLCR